MEEQLSKQHHRPKIRTLIPYEKELNEQQLDVVKNGDGRTLVLAGPGSGKTRTLVYRVAYLLQNGVPPERILLVTFTNKAAKHMLSRLSLLLGYSPSVLGGTFHHIGNVFLKKFGYLCDMSRYDIIDTADAETILKRLVKLQKKKLPSPSTLFAIQSFSTNALLTIEETIERFFPEYLSFVEEIDEVKRAYHDTKRKMNVVDFDDLLSYWYELLAHPEVSAYVHEQFSHLLIDEFQDTNRLQFEIVKRMNTPHIMAVGDDCQSIYSFRAAEIQNIFDFQKEFAANMFRLEKNYRSTAPIVSFINESIAHNTMRIPKTLVALREGKDVPEFITAVDEEGEAEVVAAIIEEKRKTIPLAEIGVLYRAEYQSAAVELALMRRQIPFIKRGGLRFFEQAHIKDVTAFLKTVYGMRDPCAWMRALTLFPHIGERGAYGIWQQLSSKENIEHALSDIQRELPPRLRQGFGVFVDVWNTVRTHADSVGLAAELFVETFYGEYLTAMYSDASSRMLDIKQYVRLGLRYSDAAAFFEDVVLDADLTNYGDRPTPRADDIDAVILSTIHQAKGLEWDTVIVIGLSEGRFPLFRSYEEGGLEEERRLFYVATSRAKNALFLTAPLSDYTYWGGASVREVSRFVRELPPHVYRERVRNQNDQEETPLAELRG